MDPATDDPRDAFFDVEHLRYDIGSRTGRSVANILFFSVLKLFIALGTTAILARLVSPEQQGLIALAVPFVLVAVGLSEFGLAQAITQMPKVTHQLASTLFWFNVALGTILTVTVAGIGSFAAIFFSQPKVAFVFWILSPYIFLTVLNTQYMALLRRRMQIRLLESCVFLATLIASFCAIIVAVAGYGVAALIVQLLAQQSLTFFFLVYSTGWRPSVPWGIQLSSAKKALAFGGYLAAERLLSDLTRTLQISIIGRSLGEAAAALYYRSETFALMPQRRIISPLSAAFIPSLSRLQDDGVAFRTMLFQQIVRSNAILIPLGAFLCVSPDLVVLVLLGPDWIEAVPILAWLGVLVLTGVSLSCFSWALVASGHSRELFYFRVCVTALIVAAIALSYHAGLVPIVRAYVIVYAILSLPLLCVFVVKYTVITSADVATSLGQSSLFAISLLGAGFAVRRSLDNSLIIEGITAGGAIIVVFGIRLLMDHQLLKDIRSTLRH